MQSSREDEQHVSEHFQCANEPGVEAWLMPSMASTIGGLLAKCLSKHER